MSPWRWLLRLLSHAVCTADEALVASLLADVASLQRFLQAREIDLNRRLQQLADASPSTDPDAVNAQATGRSKSAAGKANKRAKAADDAPRLKDEMDAGRLSGEHLDAFAAAVAELAAHLRPALPALQDELAAEAVARGLTVEQFRAHLRAVARGIEADDGVQRLEQQQRRTSLRMWTDRETGMGRISGQFDPETFMFLQQRIADQLEVRFRQDRPADCPDDPLLAQDWLRAHALADLLRGLGGGIGRPEVIIVIDRETYEHGRHARSRVDCGPGIDLPIDVIRRIGGRAMYRTCAVPGCERHISITQPHHIDRWTDGGHTDLHRLLPLCKHHHDRLHAERWDVDLRCDRSLIVRRGGAVIMSTGPPCEQWA